MSDSRLDDTERRILARLGAAQICRIAANPKSETQYLAGTHLAGSIDWEGIERGQGPWYRVKPGRIVIVRFRDYDIRSGAYTNPIATLTFSRLIAWANTIPADVRDRAREIAYPYADRVACQALADELLAPAELTLF